MFGILCSLSLVLCYLFHICVAEIATDLYSEIPPWTPFYVRMPSSLIGTLRSQSYMYSIKADNCSKGSPQGTFYDSLIASSSGLVPGVYNLCITNNSKWSVYNSSLIVVGPTNITYIKENSNSNTQIIIEGVGLGTNDRWGLVNITQPCMCQSTSSIGGNTRSSFNVTYEDGDYVLCYKKFPYECLKMDLFIKIRGIGTSSSSDKDSWMKSSALVWGPVLAAVLLIICVILIAFIHSYITTRLNHLDGDKIVDPNNLAQSPKPSLNSSNKFSVVSNSNSYIDGVNWKSPESVTEALFEARKSITNPLVPPPVSTSINEISSATMILPLPPSCWPPAKPPTAVVIQNV